MHGHGALDGDAAKLVGLAFGRTHGGAWILDRCWVKLRADPTGRPAGAFNRKTRPSQFDEDGAGIPNLSEWQTDGSNMTRSIDAMANLTELTKLNERSRTIFRQIVETYLATGEPVGSRNLSRVLPMTLSPASIRNVMSDLEHLGLIFAPHTSAGRLPTQLGLRLFVDGLLEVGDLTERRAPPDRGADRASSARQSVEQVLPEAGEMISGLSHCAGVVLADKQVSAPQAHRVRAAGAGQGAGRAGRRRPDASRTASSRCRRACRRRR